MAKQKTITLKPLNLATLEVEIIGLSDYMPEPMDMEVLERYNKLKSNQVYDKDDVSEEEKVKGKYYYMEDGKTYAIPTRAFYNAMIRASSYIFEKKDGGMRNIKEGVAVVGQYVPLEYKSEEVVTHWGRTSGRARSPRKIMRNAFHKWKTTIKIQFNKSNLSEEQILTTLNWAGFHIGVGAFRREKTGNYGMFEVGKTKVY